MRCPTNPATRRTTRRFVQHVNLTAVGGLVILITLAGCAGDPDAPGSTRDRFTELPPMPEAVEAQPSPSPTLDPALAIPEFVTGLLNPGPTLDPTERVFFRNGRDLWQLSGDEATPALAAGTRFGPYDTSPQGQRVAVVILTEINSQPAEAIHVITTGDQPGEPILPPRVIAGPNAEPSVVALSWSWDATKLAIAYDDPSIAIVDIAPPDGAPVDVVAEIDLPDNVRTIESINWAVTGQGLTYVAREDNGRGSLWVASLGGEAFKINAATLGGNRSISSAVWLPGRGRIAYIEERARAFHSLGGSMFSIAPDGSGRELLVSSGSFAPAAEISELAASPGGRFIAFTVNIPDNQGETVFHALSMVDIDSGDLIDVPVAPEFRVTDMWWTMNGLVWRAVHRDAEVVDTIADYVGFEPFLIGRFNPETGELRSLFQSTAN